MRFYVPSLLLAATFAYVAGDIFSSTAHLQNLLHLERHLVTVLHNYVETAERKMSYVRGYLEAFQSSYQNVLEGKSSVTGDEMIGNPIQAFQLVKRLSVEWSILDSVVNGNDWYQIEKLTNEYSGLMPRDEDLHGAALALVRLQETYRLNMSEMARGDIQGLQSGTGLTARDLLYLGKQSFTTGYYAHAIQWLEQALEQAHLEGNRTAGVAEISAYLTTAIEVHDDLFDRTDIDLINYDTLAHPVSRRGPTTSRELSVPRAKLGPNNTALEDQYSYMALCRGESLRTQKEEAALHCRYETGKNPYFLIGPVKTEQMSIDPYVVQFYDLITRHQADLLKELAEPKLSRSMVQGHGGTEIVSLSRTSQNAWIGLDDDPVIAHVYKVVESITGLSTDTSQEHAEKVQIANYGIGGHYTPHYDYLLVDKTVEEMESIHPREKAAGDRTATLMFYLTDVTRGGATVFPKVGAAVWPKKGSAVFWYNLKKNGKENELTLHGACPVLHGSKWVANFWIREVGQMLRRPCDLNPDL